MKMIIKAKNKLRTKSKSKILVLGLILVILVGIFAPTGVAYAFSLWPENIFPTADSLVGGVLAFLFQGILYLVSWITGLSGLLLNYVLKETVLEMKDNIAGLTGINIAWKAMRDLLNIAFIFLLVYEGILLIIGMSSIDKIRKFVGFIVLASLLVNFSLFFTKVLIDASNIVTIGFYNIIITPPVGDTTPPGEYGLSNPIMKTLGLTSLYSTEGDASFGAGKGIGAMIVMIVGSTLIMVITFFVFFAVSILFIIRYITLLILLMLSPIAYMGMALPSLKRYADQWWESLKGQLLFAPIYMILTWVVLTLMSSAGFVASKDFTAITNNAGVKPAFDSMGLILNFAIIIGLLIASLIIAKSTASQGSKLIGQATGKLSTFAGGAILGGSAWAGRKSLGFVGNKVADNANLQRDANDKKGIGGAWARTKLYTARTARDATFDIRNASVPTSVIGDVIGGTAGRTRVGKAMGLNDVNIPSVAVGAPMAGLSGVGKGGTKGYATEKTESEKRVRDRETANSTELALAEARKAVLEGSQLGATPTQIDAMEKALSKLSDKQTEVLVESNRQLLESQNFANTISVKQLETLNKSDKFSDSEKDSLKDRRFDQIKTIYDPVALAAHTAATAIPVAARTPAQIAAIKVVEDARGKVKGLSDTEIEMLDTTYLSRPEFVSELRSAQFESIAKSNKFTSSQKKTLKDTRMSPLFDALDTGRAGHAPNPALVKKTITKGLSVKDVAGLMSTNATFTDHTGAVVTTSVLTHPEVLKQYTPNMLKRMGQEMSSGDIQILRDVIEDAGTTHGASPQLTSLATWLGTPDGNNFS